MQRNTPTPGLEVILDVMPLEPHVLSTACSAAVRIREQNQKQWDGVRKGCLRGHLHGLGGILEKVDLKDASPDRYFGRQRHKCDMNSKLIEGALWGYLV